MSAKSGLACLLVAASGLAHAADLPSRAVPISAPVPPAFTWTGVYAGTMFGYAVSDRQRIRTIGNTGATGGPTDTQLAVGRRPASLSGRQEGSTRFGAAVGYDHQLDPGNGIVLGAAFDATLMNQDGRSAFASPAQAANGFVPELSGFRQQLDWMGTVRARVGYGFDRVLVYGTGGFAFGGVNYRAAFLRNTDAAIAYAGEFDGIATGYAYGGGVEYALPSDSLIGQFNPLIYFKLITPEAITVKVEYLRYDLGSRNVAVRSVLPGGPTGSFTSRFSTEGNLVRGGLTYRFGGL